MDTTTLFGNDMILTNKGELIVSSSAQITVYSHEIRMSSLGTIKFSSIGNLVLIVNGLLLSGASIKFETSGFTSSYSTTGPTVGQFYEVSSVEGTNIGFSLNG